MKRKFYFLTLLFALTGFFAAVESPAQTIPYKQWDKAYGGASDDGLTSFIPTPDGGYLLGGYSSSHISGDKTQDARGNTNDYWVVKIDSAGYRQWDKTFGGFYVEPGSKDGVPGANGRVQSYPHIGDDVLTCLAVATDGGYLLGGYSGSGTTGDRTAPNKGEYDFWIVKLDAAGNKLWDKSYGGSSGDLLMSLITTADGGYLLGGLSNSGRSGDKTEAGRGDSDYWVVKLDAAGNKLWDKTFGGDKGEYFYSLTGAPDGGFLLGGHSSSGISGDKTEAGKGDTDYWVVKINAAGSKQWDRTMGTLYADRLRSVTATADGGFLLGGATASDISGDKTDTSNGGADYWVVKLGAGGDKLWDRTFGGQGTEELNVLKATPDGGCLLGGNSASGISGHKTEASRGGTDYWVVKTDAGGNKVWDRTFGGDYWDGLYSIALLPGGGFLAAGASLSGISGDKTVAAKGRYDYWIVKTTSDAAITTRPLSSGSFCTGSPVRVSFSANVSFGSGSMFTAQLSDASGSFAAPVTIGSITSNSSSGTITAVIPAGTPAGSGYRIRVVSGPPVITGTDNGSDLTVIEAVGPNSAAPAKPDTITGAAIVCPGTLKTYSIAPVANAIFYHWTVPANATIKSGQGTTSVEVEFGSDYSPGNLSVTASNCGGSSVARGYTVVVQPRPAAPGAITGASPVCAGEVRTYSIASVAGATSYTWVLPAGATILSGQGTTTVEVRFGNEYATGVLSVKAANCGGSSAARGMAVLLRPRPGTPGYITGTAMPVCTQANDYSIVPVSGAVSYTWTVPAGAAIVSGQGSAAIKVTLSPGFKGGLLSVKATNCTGTSAGRGLMLRAAASGGCVAGAAADGADSEAQSGTLAVKAALNPFSGFCTLNIQNSRGEPITLTVVNELGRVMEQRRLAGNDLTIQLGHHYPAGLYLVQVTQGGERQLIKLVKR